jgi:hypothetical protein
MSDDPGRPIFVVGFQRSGTTLLQALIGSHPAIAAPPETHYFFRIARLADFFGDLRDDANLRRALHETLSPPLPLFADCGFEEDSLFERARVTGRSYRDLLDVVLSDFAARQGKRRWCEKTPGQPARWVFNLFPDAQVVHILRDPRDVLASVCAMPWREGSVREIAGNWRKFTRDNLRVGLDVGPAQFLTLRYEDLSGQPEEVMRIVCAYLREPFDPNLVADLSGRRATIASAAAPWQSRVLEPVVGQGSSSRRTASPWHQRARAAAAVHHEALALGYPQARRGAAPIGHLLNALGRPLELPALVRRARVRTEARTADGRYRQVQRYLRSVASTVGPPEETSVA